jgi:hypothetical protein
MGEGQGLCLIERLPVPGMSRNLTGVNSLNPQQPNKVGRVVTHVTDEPTEVWQSSGHGHHQASIPGPGMLSFGSRVPLCL